MNKVLVKKTVSVCTCNGSGWAKCPTCNGLAYVPNGSNQTPKNKPCPNCQNAEGTSTGKVRCCCAAGQRPPVTGNLDKVLDKTSRRMTITLR